MPTRTRPTLVIILCHGGYMEPKSEAIIEPKIYQIKLFRSFFEALEFKGGEITWKMSNKQRFGGIWNLWNWKHQDSSIRYTNFDLGGVGYIITTVSFFFKIDFSEFFVTNSIKIKGRKNHKSLLIGNNKSTARSKMEKWNVLISHRLNSIICSRHVKMIFL